MTESSVLERHRTLCDIIERHNRDYYVLDAPTVSDAEYDALFRELRALEEKHPKLAHPGSPTQRVGAAPREGVVKAEHRRPMLSLDNAYSENDLREFHRRAMDRTPEGRSLTYVLEPKIDGASIEVIYRDGLLTQAITRGDGKIGEDVTESVRTIRTLPLRLPDTREFSLRGEIFIHGKDLDEINESRIEAGEEPFANPRNAASGSLRLLDSQLVAKRPLRVFFYDLVEPYFETHSEILAALKDLGLPTHGREERASTIEEIVRYIEHFDRERHGLPYETDGVVIKVDSLELRETLGYTARFPRWATAYKFAAEQAKTRVEAIRCDVGRTGTLTPVADLTPVSLSGTTVARASLHNIDYVESKDVRVGDMVWIQKAGEIIPQVLGVDPTARPPGASPWMPPTHCPVCQSAVARVEGEAALRCTNPLCPGRLRAALFHFTRRSAMDIDHVGRSLIEQLVASDLVKDLADLYGLRERREALLALDRMADKSADNVLGAIDASRTGRPFERFLTGLGIPLVGTVAARLIADQYADLPTL
ncbi:MAG: NAD-dependent DNA ligase LigA, partial [Myxococcales bacterium]|nr:NAD-dependent DNA ligase LigA [Myxococcales bacterium]